MPILVKFQPPWYDIRILVTRIFKKRIKLHLTYIYFHFLKVDTWGSITLAAEKTAAASSERINIIAEEFKQKSDIFSTLLKEKALESTSKVTQFL